MRRVLSNLFGCTVNGLRGRSREDTPGVVAILNFRMQMIGRIRAHYKFSDCIHTIYGSWQSFHDAFPSQAMIQAAAAKDETLSLDRQALPCTATQPDKAGASTLKAVYGGGNDNLISDGLNALGNLTSSVPALLDATERLQRLEAELDAAQIVANDLKIYASRSSSVEAAESHPVAADEADDEPCPPAGSYDDVEKLMELPTKRGSDVPS